MRNIILWALSTDVVVSGLNLSGLELHAIKSLVIEKQSFINEENSVCVLFILISGGIESGGYLKDLARKRRIFVILLC